MYQLGLDIGSSSVKAALVNSDSGEQILVVQEPEGEMEINAPQDGWAEQRPELWWEMVCKATKRLLTETKIDSKDIETIGISYQMHGLVIVNEQLESLRDAIIWCDSRAVAIGQKAYEDLGHEYCAAHLLNSPGNFTASKLKWVLNNEPETYAQIHKYMLPGDYIAAKFTGTICTTKNGLSEGTLWDYKNNSIATELLDYYGISPALTPDIVSNFTIQGLVNDQGAIESGLAVGTKITYRSGDQPNNALSLNILKPGEVAATGGTSGVMYAVTDDLQPKEIEKVNNFAHVNYASASPVIGKLLNINGAGIQYRWLRTFCDELSYSDMNKKAAEVAIGSDGLVILPFGNGAERMFHNKDIGTQICNLKLNVHTRKHFYRAALEGIAFAFFYGVQLLKNDNTEMQVIRTGDDNLFRSSLFAETVATLIDHDIEVYHTTGAVGAARASGVVDGDFSSFSQCVSTNDHVKTYTPKKDKTAYQSAYTNWKNQLDKFI